MSETALQALIEPLHRLELDGYVTPTELRLDPSTLTWEQLDALAVCLGKLRNATAWWVGDLLLAGDAAFGEVVGQLEVALDRSPETLRRWLSVARRVAPDRRNPRLSHTHHEEVARLEPPEQVRWLDHAEKVGMSSGELRRGRPRAREDGGRDS